MKKLLTRLSAAIACASLPFVLHALAAEPAPKAPEFLGRLAYEVRSYQHRPTFAWKPEYGGTYDDYLDKHKGELFFRKEVLEALQIPSGVIPPMYQLWVVDADKNEHGVVIQPLLDLSETQQYARDNAIPSMQNEFYFIQKNGGDFYVFRTDVEGQQRGDPAVMVDASGAARGHHYDDKITARFDKEIDFWKQRDLHRSEDHK
jgi:hypothetical protein